MVSDHWRSLTFVQFGVANIETQPVAVWACTVMACSSVFFLPLVNMGLAYFGLREQISLLRILLDLIFSSGLPSIFDV
jgi:hypothetical protein